MRGRGVHARGRWDTREPGTLTASPMLGWVNLNVTLGENNNFKEAATNPDTDVRLVVLKQGGGDALVDCEGLNARLELTKGRPLDVCFREILKRESGRCAPGKHTLLICVVALPKPSDDVRRRGNTNSLGIGMTVFDEMMREGGEGHFNVKAAQFTVCFVKFQFSRGRCVFAQGVCQSCCVQFSVHGQHHQASSESSKRAIENARQCMV